MRKENKIPKRRDGFRESGKPRYSGSAPSTAQAEPAPGAGAGVKANMGKLDGKFALITGGNSGIGLATARLFIEEGAQAAIVGRNEETLWRAADELGAESFAVRADVTEAAERERMFAEVKKRFAVLDVLVACAGFSAPTALGSTEVAAFEKQVQLNFISVFFTVQGALPLLSDGATIVLVGLPDQQNRRAGIFGLRREQGGGANDGAVHGGGAESARDSRERGDAGIHAHAAVGAHAHTGADRGGERAAAAHRAAGALGRGGRDGARRAFRRRAIRRTCRGRRS